MCIVCAITLAAGIFFGMVFPSGFLVLVLCALLVILGVLMLL